jgi:hypothetical protein
VKQVKMKKKLEGEERRLRRTLEQLERDVNRLQGIKDEEVEKRREQRAVAQAQSDKLSQQQIAQQLAEAQRQEEEEEAEEALRLQQEEDDAAAAARANGEETNEARGSTWGELMDSTDKDLEGNMRQTPPPTGAARMVLELRKDKEEPIEPSSTES